MPYIPKSYLVQEVNKKRNIDKCQNKYGLNSPSEKAF